MFPLTANFGPNSDCEVLTSTWDNLFKVIIGNGWAEVSDGDIDSPVGYFALVPIGATDLVDAPGNLRAEFADDWPNVSLANEPRLRTGWYITMENTRGIIWVFRFRNEADARAEYLARELEYNTWLDADGEGI